MSDTPLTDAAADYTAPEKLHGLCKGLEVGLAEAKARIKELEDQRDLYIGRLQFALRRIRQSRDLLEIYGVDLIDANIKREGGCT